MPRRDYRHSTGYAQHINHVVNQVLPEGVQTLNVIHGCLDITCKLAVRFVNIILTTDLVSGLRMVKAVLYMHPAFLERFVGSRLPGCTAVQEIPESP